MAIGANAFSKLLAPVARCCRMLLLPRVNARRRVGRAGQALLKTTVQLPVARRAHDLQRMPWADAYPKLIAADPAALLRMGDVARRDAAVVTQTGAAFHRC